MSYLAACGATCCILFCVSHNVLGSVLHYLTLSRITRRKSASQIVIPILLQLVAAQELANWVPADAIVAVDKLKEVQLPMDVAF